MSQNKVRLTEKPKLSAHRQARRIREWAAAYRLWNERELERRRAEAGRRSVEEKLAEFFDLCEAVFRIAPRKSTALYQAQLQAHLRERERVQYFEERRIDGKPSAGSTTTGGAVLRT